VAENGVMRLYLSEEAEENRPNHGTLQALSKTPNSGISDGFV
jgi:hypothetical protein